MKFSIPFLAKQLNQLPQPGIYKNQAVEAVLFNREDLETDVWEQSWKNIVRASQFWGAENVTFHFPVNNSDYTSEVFVRNRLKEALSRASDIGLHGIVVHSNRIREIPIWASIKIADDRLRVINTLEEIRQHISSSTWLGLENMPVMDNYGKEIDPLFVYPSDFSQLLETKVKIVWDICHYTNSIASINEVLQKKQDAKSYPNIQKTNYYDFLSLKPQIAHWHFSAFSGICDPDSTTTTREGVLPNESTLGESVYADIYSKIAEEESEKHMVFEIQEECYVNRKQILKMLNWAHQR